MTTLLRIASMSLAAFAAVPSLSAQANRLDADVDRRVPQVVEKVVAWRRDIHAHPELSNRETRTADIVAQHLRALGLEVRTGVAHTGVVGVLRGGKPGPVVALRADMDALPVTEEVDVPFASKVRATYNGQEVGVMHACGHDAHTAMLMGVAEILTSIQNPTPSLACTCSRIQRARFVIGLAARWPARTPSGLSCTGGRHMARFRGRESILSSSRRKSSSASRRSRAGRST